MTLRQQWLTVLGIVVGLGLLLGIGAFTMRDELFPLVVGSQAPDFAARPSIRAYGAAFRDYRCKVVVLKSGPPCSRRASTRCDFARCDAVPDTNLAIGRGDTTNLRPDSVSAFVRNLGVHFGAADSRQTRANYMFCYPERSSCE